MKKKAFTLIELMVAMAIIGVLIGLTVYGISIAQQAQRDTERKSALSDITLGETSYEQTYSTAPKFIDFDSSNAYIGDVSGLSSTNCSTSHCVAVHLKGAAIPSVVGNLNGASMSVLGTQTNTTTTKYGFENCTSGYYIGICLEGGKPYSLGTCSDSSITMTCP